MFVCLCQCVAVTCIGYSGQLCHWGLAPFQMSGVLAQRCEVFEYYSSFLFLKEYLM